MPTVRTVSKYLSFVLLFLLLLAGPSCSVKNHHKTLSLFFDGVPEPGAENKKGPQGPAPGKKAREKPAKEALIVSRHPAYTQRKCRDCHNTQSLSFLKDKKAGLCFTCHNREKYTGDFLHGPVAVGACHVCHLPHESKYERLLKSGVPQICIDCHTTWDRRDVKAHSKGKVCTQCHDPHAGNNRFFLREMKDEGRGT